MRFVLKFFSRAAQSHALRPIGPSLLSARYTGSRHRVVEFVPVMAGTAGITQKSGVSPPTSTARWRPFTLIVLDTVHL
jgi:hypothetical protein